jgi:hypothetical protein
MEVSLTLKHHLHCPHELPSTLSKEAVEQSHSRQWNRVIRGSGGESFDSVEESHLKQWKCPYGKCRKDTLSSPSQYNGKCLADFMKYIFGVLCEKSA